MNIKPIGEFYHPENTPKSGTNFLYNYEKTNRLIIIGNGFDLAHGLKSSFKDFIYVYAHKAIEQTFFNLKYDDPLMTITANAKFSDAENFFAKLTPQMSFEQLLKLTENTHIRLNWKSRFFKNLINDLENKKWVDIEIHYFDNLKKSTTIEDSSAILKLNNEFTYLKSYFLNYLLNQTASHNCDIDKDLLTQFEQPIKVEEVEPNTLEHDTAPNELCILNFNYTDIAIQYYNGLKLKNNQQKSYIPIHGNLNWENSNLQEPVFGFGDEIDEDYKKFELMRNDEVFMHIKSFKYLQSNNYRKLLELIESNPFQVHIYGHSCGLSDRTLLNTIFEHENCISIKPFFFKNNDSNDYELKSFAIARHFKSKSKFRGKVVNIEYCEAMIQPLNQ